MNQAGATNLLDTHFWEGMTMRERANFQMFEARLCMPWGVFHEAVEATLNRPVHPYEFDFGRDLNNLKDELLGLNSEAPLQN
jgi:hypothetical protein